MPWAETVGWVIVGGNTIGELGRMRSGTRGMRSRDGACAVRSDLNLHGVTIHLNGSRPPPSQFELRRVTPSKLHYDGASQCAFAC